MASNIVPENFQHPDEFYNGLQLQAKDARQRREVLPGQLHLDQIGGNFRHYELY
jgi:hypothetical protein